MTTRPAEPATDVRTADRPLWWHLAIAVLLVGVLAAAAGIVLLLFIRLVQHVTFGYWDGSFAEGVNRADPARRAIGMAVGGLVTGVAWWLFRRHVRTEEVSVTHALRDPRGRLPLGPSVGDSVLQMVGVGVGASLGREGAARQAAAAIAGWIAARLRIAPADRHVLIACGAGAGLAALYNVPVSGMLYTLEVLLALASWRAVIPAVVTSAVATVLTWPVLSNAPTYQVQPVSFSVPVLVWALLLGPVAGLAGAGFMRLMRTARTHAPRGPWVIVGVTASFAALGATGMVLPELLGNGKSMAQLIFDGGAGLAVGGALALLKPLATAACLGGGAIGGLLTPSYSTGAALGLAGGLLWSAVWPGAPVASYAIVGSAALLAVTQRAPLTGIALALEFAHTGLELLPAIVLAVGLAALTAWLVDRSMIPIPLAARRERREVAAGG